MGSLSGIIKIPSLDSDWQAIAAEYETEVLIAMVKATAECLEVVGVAGLSVSVVIEATATLMRIFRELRDRYAIAKPFVEVEK